MALYLSDSMWPWLAYAIAALVHVVLILSLVAVSALVFIWLERKISGRIQDRLGPTRVGGKFGWLQTLADGLKLLTKEDLMPGGADRLLARAVRAVIVWRPGCRQGGQGDTQSRGQDHSRPVPSRHQSAPPNMKENSVIIESAS